MSELILLRHGQSTWNQLNLFTGWVDVDLTDQGRGEAAASGQLLKSEELLPTVVHTSLLGRAIETANLALSACGRSWIPVTRSWRLNERHYGALQGLDKTATLTKYGEEQLNAWRRSYDTPPPPIVPGTEFDTSSDPRYAGVTVPASECLKDVVERMVPYWDEEIVPDLAAGERVLVVAHGNSLRGLIKHLEGISDDDIAELNVPTGAPRLYQLDGDLTVTSARYLGDADEVASRAAAVAAQARGAK